MVLNKEQQEAADHFNGPCLVTACPGSGKSRVIVERTFKLINNGVSPSAIVCITFTNKAAGEMKERIEKKDAIAAKQIYVSTFHKLCASILRFHGHNIGYKRNISILDTDDQYDLMAQVTRQLGYEITKPEIQKIIWHTNDFREKLESDNDLFKRLTSVKDGYYDIAEEYLKRLHAANSIDFSGMLSETVRLLTSCPNVLQVAQNKWKYCMVDETQDTNVAQFKIIEILFSHTKNIFIVGDINQSIYSWRGANIENIRQFKNKYSDAKVLFLGKNYRSTPEIVSISDKLIKNDPNRIDSPFITDNPSGDPIFYDSFSDDKVESEFVAKKIKSLVDSGKFSYKDIAVFYRTNNMSRAVEMAMINNNIPHTLIGGFSFFDRKEIKDCISMLRFLVNPLDGVAFHRICNKPKRNLGDASIGRIELYAKNNNCDILHAAKSIENTSEKTHKALSEIISAFDFEYENKSISECLSILISKLRYKDYINEDIETAIERQENIDELIKDAAKFSEENPKATIGAYLDQIALLSSYDKNADGDSVSLQTLHSSKGLEYKVVFMVGLEQGILPNRRAMEENIEGLSEERRLAFVGFTRSMEKLFLTSCQRRQDGYAAKGGKVFYKKTMPSQFLYECGILKKVNNLFAERITPT